ncbi:diguanylate cyclase domain-containing protein [Thiovibrio sp. JS02]
MTAKRPLPNTAFYPELEEQARRYPLHSVRLGGSGPSPIGLLFVADGTPGRELEAALSALNLGNRHFSSQPASARSEGEGALPDAAWLRKQLRVELDRVTRTRLPCALLLMRLTGKGRAKELVARATLALEPCLHQVDLLASWQDNGLALILPGTNVGKARKRAEEIRDRLRSFSANPARQDPAPGLALGIAVCHAYDTISAEELLNLAEDALRRAANGNTPAICHAAAAGRPEDSCQVTVEERAQLFSFLQKETCP